MRTFPALAALCFSLVTTLGASSAHATLGRHESAIEDDRRALSGVLRSPVTRGQNVATYRVYEIVTGGRTLREYVAHDGTVFGIAWQGVAHPDLSGLLGDYASDLADGLRDRREARAHEHAAAGRADGDRDGDRDREGGRHSHHELRSGRVVISRSGHLRAMRGQAYVPALLPEGVSADEIR